MACPPKILVGPTCLLHSAIVRFFFSFFLLINQTHFHFLKTKISTTIHSFNGFSDHYRPLQHFLAWTHLQILKLIRTQIVKMAMQIQVVPKLAPLLASNLNSNCFNMTRNWMRHEYEIVGWTSIVWALTDRSLPSPAHKNLNQVDVYVCVWTCFRYFQKQQPQAQS